MTQINVMISNQNTLLANFSALFCDSSNLLRKIGTKTEARAPSAKMRRNRLGSLNATLTLSATGPEPKRLETKISRAMPKIRDRRVYKATTNPERSTRGAHNMLLRVYDIHKANTSINVLD